MCYCSPDGEGGGKGRSMGRTDPCAKCYVLKAGQGGKEPAKPTQTVSLASPSRVKKNGWFYFVLLSWQAWLCIWLRDFCLFACFKLARVFHVDCRAFAPRELLSTSPYQQGAAQTGLYPCCNLGVVRYPTVEMPVWLSSTLWRLPGRWLETG